MEKSMKKNKKIDFGTWFLYYGSYLSISLVGFALSLVMWFVYLQHANVTTLNDFVNILPLGFIFFCCVGMFLSPLWQCYESRERRKQDQIHREYMCSTNDQRYQEYYEGKTNSFHRWNE